ncbi:uncharacterized protein LOC111052645 [Nilaparvata lugens]|uniref:uncharacterized protein LOC111052645 n=1 Tax=Nilaparvata lugens TaxID=108931 RepID=UPI00193EBC9B|nr:uncharacterized protein LOC111052645 [Nilaparvata lugens]
MPLNIFIALVGVVVWTEHDEFHIDTNGDTTLTNFLQYRRTTLIKEHPNDNAQLLTRVQFEGGVVGKALKGPICTYEFSGGVNMDHSPVVGLVATTVAHEMGHNFGMEHDGSSCECPEEKCIMASSSSSSSPTHWSSCSYEYLLFAFGHGMDYCLRNKPTSLFDSPVCGNGFVEPGEQCDCGLPGHCTNPCCNMTSCMLYSNASCATGECCDFSAYCYQGSCRSHSDQCKLLWGPSGMSSDTQCYKMNSKGNRYGNCGYNRLNQSYLKCEGDNVHCGMLHCKHLNEKLEFGMESVAILSHSFISSIDNEVIPCRTAIVDLGLNEVDPGLAPDGAKCGVGMMCVNQKCMNVSSLRAASLAGDCPKGCSGNGVCNSLGHCHCKVGFAPPHCDYPGTGGSLDSGPATDPHDSVLPDCTTVDETANANGERSTELQWAFCMCVNQKCMNVSSLRAASLAGDCPKGCSGNGVCNSLGHCHCKVGFAPPHCDYPGTGGSLDSGPATDPHAHWEVVTALYAIFFGIVPFLTIVGLITYHLRHKPSPFWRKKPRSIIIIEKKPSGGGGGGQPGDKRPSTGSSQLASDHSRASLLQSSDSSPGLPDDNPGLNPFHNNLLGQFKGFSITPLPPKSTASSTVCLPSRPAPQPISPPKLPNNVAVVAPVRSAPKPPTLESPAPPTLPPANPTSRPAISSPVLDTTTSCTAQELLKNVPIRKAPQVPSCPTDQVAVVCETNAADNKPKQVKESYPALTRLASFMARSQKENKKDNIMGGSLRVSKLDRDALRNLEISNPIPQKEIDVPGEHVFPAGPDKAVVMRAQSLRDSERKPNVHSFGSMRFQDRSKRPTSIAVSARPSSPPPPRPPNQVEHEYDDCINLADGAGAAPLVDIDEESLSSPNDNIYAVIDETPIDRSEPKKIVLPKKLSKSEYTSPTGEYKVPKPLDNNMSAGSSESMGLLGEIVSEIEARNTESIYSSSTLKRKKDRDDETSSTVTDMSDNKSNQIYVNTPWQAGYSNFNSTPKYCASSNSSNSGYMSPISTNRLGELKTESEIGKSEDKNIPSVSVPEVSAPSYKPYSSTRSGPFAAYYNKSNSDPKKSTDSNEGKTSSFQNSDINTKSSASGSDVKGRNTESKKDTVSNGSSERAPFLNRALPPINNGVNELKAAVKPSVPPNNIGLSTKQKSDINNLPSKNTVVPNLKPNPDRLSENDSEKDSKKDTNLVSKPTQNKPKSIDNSQPKTVLPLRNVPKNSSFRTGRTPLPAPKPVSIPSVKPNPSSLKSSLAQAKAPLVNGRTPATANLQTKVAPPVNTRQSATVSASSGVSEADKQDSKKIVPQKPAVNRSSNVASLQQKFETSNNRPMNGQKVVNRPNLASVKSVETDANR